MIVRALPNKDSLKILEDLGIPEENWIIGQGPFSYEDNVTAIKEFDVRTLVTKDSGTRGGTEEKIQAALDQGCKIVVVQRPPSDETILLVLRTNGTCQRGERLLDNYVLEKGRGSFRDQIIKHDGNSANFPFSVLGQS